MKELSFEQAVTRLDEIVKMLEKGDAPLEQALDLFEEGTRLIKECGQRLDKAEQRVTLLRKGADGEPAEEPFDITETEQ